MVKPHLSLTPPTALVYASRKPKFLCRLPTIWAATSILSNSSALTPLLMAASRRLVASTLALCADVLACHLTTMGLSLRTEMAAIVF